MIEEWKDIPNYEGLYQISTLGRVKSFIRCKTSIIMKNKMENSNIHYSTIDLHKNSKRKQFSIHQLVAITFLNHIPCRDILVVDHIDNNKKNNKLSNLQIITVRQNYNKAKKSENLNYSSIYSGISFYSKTKKWRCQIFINKKIKHLGYFETEIEAKKVYDEQLKLTY